jgi:hypothetical protein
MKRSPPSWYEARRALLESAVTDLIDELEKGSPIGRSIKLTAAKYRKRSLGFGRRLRLSRKTLERIYYAWEAAGRDSKAFELRYKPGLPAKPVDPLLVRALVSYCVTQVVSVAIALKELEVLRDSSISLRTFYRRIPVLKIREYLHTYNRSLSERAKLEARNARHLARLKTQILAAV